MRLGEFLSSYTAQSYETTPEGELRLTMWFEKELPFAGYSVVKEPYARGQDLKRKLGGEYRARTGDLLVANQALSQLS